jgi:hypothetical protein
LRRGETQKHVKTRGPIGIIDPVTGNVTDRFRNHPTLLMLCLVPPSPIRILGLKSVKGMPKTLNPEEDNRCGVSGPLDVDFCRRIEGIMKPMRERSKLFRDAGLPLFPPEEEDGGGVDDQGSMFADWGGGDGARGTGIDDAADAGGLRGVSSPWKDGQAEGPAPVGFVWRDGKWVAQAPRDGDLIFDREMGSAVVREGRKGGGRSEESRGHLGPLGGRGKEGLDETLERIKKARDESAPFKTSMAMSLGYEWARLANGTDAEGRDPAFLLGMALVRTGLTAPLPPLGGHAGLNTVSQLTASNPG